MKNKATCPMCGSDYRMGYTGTVNGCDGCQGIVRDADGYFYEPDEDEIVLMDVESGAIEKRKRPEVSA